MKPSVTSLAAPNHPATHPPTQPDEPIEKKSPGTEARGFSTRGLFQQVGESASRETRLLHKRSQGSAHCQKCRWRFYAFLANLLNACDWLAGLAGHAFGLFWT